MWGAIRNLTPEEMPTVISMTPAGAIQYTNVVAQRVELLAQRVATLERELRLLQLPVSANWSA